MALQTNFVCFEGGRPTAALIGVKGELSRCDNKSGDVLATV